MEKVHLSNATEELAELIDKILRCNQPHFSTKTAWFALENLVTKVLV